MMNRVSPAASTGWVDPRSRSLALSSAQLAGAKKPSRCRFGLSLTTESLPSYGSPGPAAPFPVDTHRSPSGPVTGPPVPQMAPSLLVGVMQLMSVPAAGQRHPDQRAAVLPAVARQPAERHVHPSVVDGQPRSLLVVLRVARRARECRARTRTAAVAHRQPEQHVVHALPVNISATA